MPARLLALSIVCLLLPFLTAAEPASTSAPAPKPSINDAALDKLGWKLGCQAWTFRKLSLFETLDTLQGLGIHYIEMYPGQHLSKEQADVKFDHNATQEQIDAVLAKCKSAGVTPMSYGVVGLTNDEAEARKVFEFAKRMGLSQIVSEPPADAFAMLDKLTDEYHIKLAIHDHPKPSHYWNPDTVLEVVKDRSNRIGACADVGHWYRSGLVPVDCLKKLEGRIIELHFKDIAPNKEDVPWGSGKCDVPAMLAELKRQNVKALFSIEYETGEGAELLNNVAKSIDYFSQQVSELAK